VQEQVQAQRKEDVLQVLAQIGDRFRRRLGESLATVERHSTPLPEATTRSIEALNAYVRGESLTFTKGFAEANAAYRRAIEIDPQFAIAHAQLGLGYAVQGEEERAVASITRAYELRDRTSAPERFFITFTYDRNVTGNLIRAQETLRAWADAYPRNLVPLGLLGGFASHGVGDFELAVRSSEQVLARDPNFAAAYLNIAPAELARERIDEAERAIGKADQAGVDMFEVLLTRYSLAFLRNDDAGMAAALEKARTRAGSHDRMLHVQSLTLARSGRLQEARRIVDRAREIAAAAGNRHRAALYLAGAAVQNALFGRRDQARQLALEALNLSSGRELGYAAGFALALTGGNARAEAIVRDMETRFPDDTCVRFTYVPVLRALLALASGEPARAVTVLENNEPYELALVGLPFNFSYGAMYPVYARGEAYLASGRSADAVREFEKFLAHPGLVLFDPIGALARLQLARAHAAAGRIDDARRRYDEVLALWKDADADLPVVQQARAEARNLTVPQ
jgi:tetratricopeptide (TPR) repeat protein